MKIPKGNHQSREEKEWKGLGKVPRDLPRFSPNFAGMLQWRKFQRILRRPGQGNKIVSPNFVGEPLETTQLSRFRQTFKTRLDTEEFLERIERILRLRIFKSYNVKKKAKEYWSINTIFQAFFRTFQALKQS